MLRILMLLVAALVIGAAALTGRAFTLQSRQPVVTAAPAVALDINAAAARLGEAIRFRTVSWGDTLQRDRGEFERFHAFLAERFPRTHAALARDTVAGLSLLYRWDGTDTTRAPALLLAHQDVVPVEPGTEGRWTHPPFDGVVADGYIWGRGALDDKASLLAILEAIEGMLAEGKRPTRSVWLAFGHDEEIGGLKGAVSLAARLAAEGRRFDFVLDEGGALVGDAFPGLTRPVAFIAVAEKGYLSVELTARAAAGHSSTPPRPTAVGRLATAIAALEASPFPSRFDGTTRTFFTYLAPELPFGLRVALANADILWPVLGPQLGANPTTAALFRTTTAPTMLRASPKDNVLASEATGVVNFRILPGDSVNGVMARVREIIADTAVSTRRYLNFASEPSPVSPDGSPNFARLMRTVREIVPDAVVVPGLTTGATDARYYTGLSPDVYRFAPFRIVLGDLRRAHGTDERLSVAAYGEGIRFYRRLLEGL